MPIFELNLDGLVGPTHHYAGLSFGNLASTHHAGYLSNPQAAALQGLAKMRLMLKLGLKQGLMPPHQRPNVLLLDQLGFKGKASQQIEKAYREAPLLLSASYSSSFMWAANAATVSSSLDTADRRVHFTAANLVSNLHRHQEANFTQCLLETLFLNQTHFKHHPILPKSLITADEGAANHSRLCALHSQSAVHLFVYGKEALNTKTSPPLKFPARQTLEASQAIARSHGLNPEKVVFACQNPKAIAAGVFHNDVIAVVNESVLFIHEEAFANQRAVLAELQKKADFPIQVIEVKKKRLSLALAVRSYLFNSQLITLPNQSSMALIAPTECQDNPVVKHYIDELLSDDNNPISTVYYLNLRQSMQNGGGPACLRLRIPLTEPELLAMHQGILVTDPLLDRLEAWVNRHYRNQLALPDLADPQLIDDCFKALDELSQLLELGSIYPFQRNMINSRPVS